MREAPRLDWSVPADEWQQFREYVAEEFGSINGYLARETENAMQEYADQDGYAGVEERVRRLYEATGRTNAGEILKQKNLSEDRTRVAVRVDERIAEEFRKFVDQQDDADTYGIELARALCEYLDGGRAGRLERHLDEIVDEVEGALEDEFDTGDEGVSLSQKERKVMTIANELGDQFTGAELNAEIHEIAGRGAKASDPTLKDYREQVIERKGVVRHPFATDEVWMQPDDRQDLIPDAVPDECALPVDQLDHDDRVWRVIYAVGRRAAKRSAGRVTVHVDTVREDILNGEVGHEKTLTYLEEAAVYDGVEIRRNDEHASLRVNLRDMKNAAPSDFNRIIEYRDTDADPILGELTETTVTDYTQTKANAEGNAQTAMTDGGNGT